ncbi:hypothetical protein QAD02_006211 [Eretmocerus hayati]|uniref:Uncharacterized protein n=1 Tax=Eretmocerus hayati TaxID=131215 RepID=A0ACC2N2N0_9HYME|nr:hypothetical protein QAD02_006211 [Eretmocerus hayati]
MPSKPTWVKAKVVECLGARNYICQTLDDNLKWKRHLDQIRKAQNLYDPENKFFYDESPNKPYSSQTRGGGDSRFGENVDSIPKELSSIRNEGGLPEARTSQEKNTAGTTHIVENESDNVKPKTANNLDVNLRPKRDVKKPVKLDL